jgi:NADH:ubiquinone oxidoreductase subunit H
LYLFFIVNVVFRVGFLLLYERKVLGLFGIREGSFKVGYLGLIQFVSDSLKLIFKEFVESYYFNKFFYYFSPIFMFFLSLVVWFIIPYINLYVDFSLGFIVLMVILGFKVFFFFFMG